MKSLPASISLLVLLLCLGCAENGFDVKGRITIDGNPVTLESGHTMKVGLRPADATTALTPTQKSGLIATVAADGSFDLHNVSPGNYFAIVSDFESFPSRDRLADHFRKFPESMPCTVDTAQTAFDLAVDSTWLAKPRRK